MALIKLKEVWVFESSYQDPNDPRIFGDIYRSNQWFFNTISRSAEAYPIPTGGYYDWYRGTGADPGPQDFSLDTTIEFFRYVQDDTRYGYFHDGNGDVRVVEQTLVVTATPIGCDCYGEARGIIDVVVSGLPGPYTFLWADGPTTQDRTALRAGTYQLTVTHTESGARRTVTVQISQNPRLEVVVAQTDALVQLQISGGVGPYTVLWSDGRTELSRTDISGTRTFTVTDSLGCTATGTVTVADFRYYLVGNPITLTLDAGQAYRDDPTTKPNLSFACEVWVEQDYFSGTFALVGTVLEQPADRDGRTTFQLQELLRPHLTYHVPEPGQTTVTLAGPLFRRFYFKWAEISGDPPVRAASTTLSNHYALLGGLDFYEARARTWWNGYQETVKPFLTWEPNGKYVFDDQPEFLYHQAFVPGSVFARVRATFADGTTQVAPLGSYANARRYEVLCVPCGYALVGRQFSPDRGPIVSWEVWMQNGGGALRSETRRFLRDRQRPVHVRYFLHANSLGGMNTYVATGEAIVDVEVTGDEADLALPADYDPLQGDTAVLDRTLRPVLKWATGLRSTAERVALQDLLLSRRVLLLSRAGDQWRAGYLKAKTVALHDESKLLQGHELEFYLPRQKYFTPCLPVVAAGVPVAALPAYSTLLP